MVDCAGKELKIGDKVVCSDMRYADLLIGEIIDFTPKKARVRYVRSEYQHLSQKEQLKESYQIFKYSDGGSLQIIEVAPDTNDGRKKTNFDRIKEMSVEEFSEFLCKLYFGEDCPPEYAKDLAEFFESEVNENG